MLVPRQPIETFTSFTQGIVAINFQVRVALYKDRKEVQSLKFNAVNDNVEWFTKKNLNFSTWDDLISNSSLKHFELQPINEKAKDTLRSFEISEKYAGCKNDVGWLMISTDTNPCAFERKNPLSILYSKKNGSSVYKSEGKADKSQLKIVTKDCCSGSTRVCSLGKFSRRRPHLPLPAYHSKKKSV